jgi:protein tyrosine phosphatase
VLIFVRSGRNYDKPQKSELIKEIEMKLINDDERVPSNDSELQTPCITDVMTNIRKIKTKDIQTFEQFCEQFLDYVSGVARGPERLYLVFDSYVRGSMKYSERNRRQDKAPIEINYINSDTPLPVEMDRFWSSSNNKT